MRSIVLPLLLAVLPVCAERVTVEVIATTDMHGNIFPVDYFTAKPANRGLTKIASLIAEARRENPHHVLIDCGDTIQGSPLAYLYQTYVRTGRLPLDLKFAGEPLRGDPMMKAMSALRYDAMVLGNHEFNYGLKVLEQSRRDASFPWLSANTLGGTRPFQPYLIKKVAGVKIAIVGITTQNIPTWEKPENMGQYRWEDGRIAAERVVAQLREREKPDIVVVAIHGGLGRDLKTGQTRHADDGRENQALEIAEKVPGIHAVIFGHSHQELASHRVNGVLMMQPKNWAISLGRMTFTLEGAPGSWKIVESASRLVPVRAETPADETIAAIGKPYHDLTERYLSTPVTDSPAELLSRFGRVEDTALLDAIQQVQMHYAKADVSFASMFNLNVQVPKGPVTVRQIAALYLYDNTLYAIEGDGQMVKDALENSARFYLGCEGARCEQLPLTDRNVMGYNYDVAQGVTYEVDLTRPVGDRIRNLRFQGQPLSPSRKLRIAINNYRFGGSGGYTMFRNAPVLWQSSEEIRDLIIEYYTERKKIPVSPDQNWKLSPPAAAETLRKDAASFRPQTM